MMPELGEIGKGFEIGYRSCTKHIWSACIDCGKERWVQCLANEPRRKRCPNCAARISRGRDVGELSPVWKGGRTKSTHGYIQVLLQPDDFFYAMVNNKRYVPEHRLVMAKQLGRNLHSWELVHHKNRIRTDNRIENLQLVTDDRHTQITILENRIAYLEGRVTILEAERILAENNR